MLFNRVKFALSHCTSLKVEILEDIKVEIENFNWTLKINSISGIDQTGITRIKICIAPIAQNFSVWLMPRIRVRISTNDPLCASKIFMFNAPRIKLRQKNHRKFLLHRFSNAYLLIGNVTRLGHFVIRNATCNSKNFRNCRNIFQMSLKI